MGDDEATLPPADAPDGTPAVRERLLAASTGRPARGRFVALLGLALLLHAGIIAAFLWRDRRTPRCKSRATRRRRSR